MLIIKDHGGDDGDDKHPHIDSGHQKAVEDVTTDGHVRIHPQKGQKYQAFQKDQKKDAHIESLMEAQLIKLGGNIIEHQLISLFRKVISPTAVETRNQPIPTAQAWGTSISMGICSKGV